MRPVQRMRKYHVPRGCINLEDYVSFQTIPFFGEYATTISHGMYHFRRICIISKEYA